MTENEAIEEFQQNINLPFGSNISVESSRMAINALKEFQMYHEGKLCLVPIGTLERQSRELDEYKDIGTVEELRLAKEKQIPKKPKEYEDKFYACPICGNVLLHKWKKYNTELMDKSNGLPYCLSCGQKIDWSEVVE